MCRPWPRDAAKPELEGRIEIDDAYLGGERSGKRGRGSAGKTPFVAAVETAPDQRLRRFGLTVVDSFRTDTVERPAKTPFAPGSYLVSDGLTPWPVVERAAGSHWSMAIGAGRRAARCAPFNWINTAFGDLNTALAGTHHHVNAKHAQRYLASFACRFNRRHQLDSMTERLAFACVDLKPHPYHVIAAG